MKYTQAPDMQIIIHLQKHNQYNILKLAQTQTQIVIDSHKQNQYKILKLVQAQIQPVIDSKKTHQRNVNTQSPNTPSQNQISIPNERDCEGNETYQIGIQNQSNFSRQLQLNQETQTMPNYH